MPHRHEGILGQLLVAQQQAIDLRARLDREHRAGEGFLRFGERAIEASSLESFFEITAEEVVVTFDTESALLLRISRDDPHLLASCGVDALLEHEVTPLGAYLSELAPGRSMFRTEGLPEVAGRAPAVLLAAAYQDSSEPAVSYVILGLVSQEKVAFYPSFDDGFAPLFAAFSNHAAALQQHLRSRVEGRRVAKQMKRLADVASRTSNAVVITDRAGTIEWVNESFVRLTGYTPEEVVGKRPGAILQGPGTDPEVRAEIREAIARFKPFEVELLNYRKDGRQYYVQIQTRVTYDEHGEPTGFVALESDVTQRRIAERRDGLAQRVAGMLLRSDSLHSAGDQVVRDLVTQLDIPIAQLWAVTPGQPTLTYVAGFASPAAGKAGAELIELTRSIEFHPGPSLTRGVGIPGKAWFTGEAAFTEDVTNPAPDEGRSRRVVAADRAGVQAFCAVPVLGTSGPLGIIEVGTPRGHPFNEVLPALLGRIAEHLAAFVLRDLTRRNFQTMFDQSPDALLLVGSDGHVEAMNARARATFGAMEGAHLDAILEEGSALMRAALGPRKHDDLPPMLIERFATAADGAAFTAEVSVSSVATTTGHAALLALRDLTDRRRMEQQLTDSLREKETLLKEIHHRVKNNLQIISGLLSLQMEQMPSERARELLLEGVHRVRSMALIHEHLYGNDSLRRIDLADYTRTLAESLRSALAPSVRLRLDVADIELSIEQAVPVGLILNELVTNALKYGVGAGRATSSDDVDVWVRLRERERRCIIEVGDFGPGLPPGFEPARATSLGLHLVRTLTRQLRGGVTVTSERGVTWTIDFPLDDPAASPAR